MSETVWKVTPEELPDLRVMCSVCKTAHEIRMDQEGKILEPTRCAGCGATDVSSFGYIDTVAPNYAWTMHMICELRDDGKMCGTIMKVSLHRKGKDIRCPGCRRPSWSWFPAKEHP